jgi:hypothetical protein
MADKLTNIFSSTYRDERQIKQILANLSIGDTKHDFHYPMSLLQNTQFKESYNYGLPIGFNDIFDEEGNLSSIISSYTVGTLTTQVTDTNKYSPIKVSNPTYEVGKTNNHQITTKNGKTFTVSYTDVKPKSGISGKLFGGKEINAKKFYEDLGLDGAEFNNIAIVVDAASIKLLEILTKGPSLTGKEIYYIFGPEIVNDPATKKQPFDKIFINNQNTPSNNGAKIFSCTPPKSSRLYNYGFRPNNSNLLKTPYLDMFFTNYNFELTELKENINGKSISYITNLDIKGNTGEINPVTDSGTKNEIRFIETLIEKFLNMFKISRPKNLNPSEKFLFSSSLQQKRSGDWLQVLLCSSIKDKLRNFKVFNSDNEDVVKKLNDVIFVTHDQIALAFALLNGINCIFTHHSGPQHFHSAFSFIEVNPERAAEQANIMARDYKSSTTILALQNDIDTIIQNMNTYIDNKYMITTNEINRQLRDAVDRIIGGISTKFASDRLPYNTASFATNTRDFFTYGLELVFSKSIYPDMRIKIDELNNIKANLSQQLTEGIADTIIIDNYNNIKTSIDNIKNLFNTINSISIDNYNKQMTNFKKSNIYKSAAIWTWDINLSSREVIILSDPTNPINYKTDRNIFLYNLNNLDSDLKQKIAYIYYKEYEGLYLLCLNTIPGPSGNLNNNFTNGYSKKIGSTTPISLGDRGYTKFRAVSLAFCIEVLLTLGGGEGLFAKPGITPVPHINITRVMDNFLAGLGSQFNTLINDGLIVQEDDNYNRSPDKGTTDSGVDIVVPDIDTDKSIPDTDFTQRGGEHIIGGAFEISIKQVTYPLMTLIFFAPYSENLIAFQEYLFELEYSSEELTRVHDIDTGLESSLPGEEKNIPIISDIQEIEPSLQPTIKPKTSVIPSRPSTRESKRLADFKKGIDTPEERRRKMFENYQKQQQSKKNLIVTSKRGLNNYTGGGISSNLGKLFEALPPLSEDENSKINFNETTDIFKDNRICFHPLLPVYMLTQAYITSINNQDILTSLDCDLIVNYFQFLRKIKELVINIYSGENNNNDKKIEAYAIGLGLKQLLFVSNNTNEGYLDCIKVLNTDDSIYSSVSSYTECLNNTICGKITLGKEELVDGPIYLKSQLFTDFAQNIDVKSIFETEPDYSSFVEETFKTDVLKFSSEVAKQIITDRGLTYTEIVPTPITGLSPQERAERAARGNILAQEKAAKGTTQIEPTLRPFDPSRIKTSKDIGFTYSDGDKSNIVSSTTSSSTRSTRQGGKKRKNTRRTNKKTNKNKTHKRLRKHRITRRTKK